MDSCEQGPKITFTQWGHKFESGYVDAGGYAQCVQCGCVENSDDMVHICPESVILEDLERKAKAVYEVVKEIKKQ